MKTKIPCLNIDTSKRDTRLKKNKNNVVEIVAYSHIDISELIILVITCNRMHYWWINGRFHFLGRNLLKWAQEQDFVEESRFILQSLMLFIT